LKNQLLIWINRSLWLAIWAGVAFGFIGPAAYRLVPWYVYGRRAAEENIRVVEPGGKVGGRSVRLSNGDTLHESDFDGLILAMFICLAVTALVCFAMAKLIEHRLVRGCEPAVPQAAG
jgi:hypothetical protein